VIETQAHQPADSLGLLPYRIWIGVTGHRRLTPEPKLLEHVRKLIHEIRRAHQISRRTEVRLGVISGLAEGADRIVARAVLDEPGAILEAALPLSPDDYSNDFATVDSKEEFRELLQRASSATVVGESMSGREAAYARVGEYIVSRADVVIALWDGKAARGKGGTANVVALARSHHVGLVWIRPSGDYQIQREGDLGAGVGLNDIDAYNRLRIDSPRLREGLRRRIDNWLLEARQTDLPIEPIETILRWAGPVFSRADDIASKRQRRYLFWSHAILVLATIAVSLVALISIFNPMPRLAALEAVTLIGVLVIVYYVRRKRLHSWWIHSRLLAEHVRAALFLAVLAAALPSRDAVLFLSPERSLDWVSRSLRDLWLDRPKVNLQRASLQSLKDFLTKSWMEDQLDYYRRTGAAHLRSERRLTVGIVALFSLALALAVIHAIEITPLANFQRIILLCCLVLPAAAAAISGIHAQGEHTRNADRFAQIAKQLELAAGRLSRAPTREALFSAAVKAAGLMLEEQQQWFGVMEFHDVELHV